MQVEADRRVAAAEQRAVEAETAAAEAHETAVRLETEIERRVMEGSAEVRREAEESVRKLVEKVEREAEEAARARAEDQLQHESDRIRVQAQRREDRAREVGEGEIKASASKARREAQAAAEESAPTWLRTRVRRLDGRLPHLLGREDLTSASRCARFGSGTRSAASRGYWTPTREVGIYACGPTVYSRIHIGNARPFVVFSLFARFLRSQGYAARLVVNVTDVNDKIYLPPSGRGRPRPSSRRG